MDITRKSVYLVNGKTYDTVEAAEQAVYDLAMSTIQIPFRRYALSGEVGAPSMATVNNLLANALPNLKAVSELARNIERFGSIELDNDCDCDNDRCSNCGN